MTVLVKNVLNLYGHDLTKTYHVSMDYGDIVYLYYEDEVLFISRKHYMLKTYLEDERRLIITINLLLC